MKKRLKRIAPLQAGLVLALLYALLSLLIIPFFAFAALIATIAPAAAGAGFPAAGAGIGMMIFMSIMAPVLYGTMGFIFGALSALAYNLVAKWVGGLEFEVE